MKTDYTTKQRNIILSFLTENSAHLTANDIKTHLSQLGYNVSTATIYRTLDKYVKEGIVKKYQIGDKGSACYQFAGSKDCNTHFHLKCLGCGVLIHLDCDFLENMENHIYKEHGFSVSSGQTVIYGICENCKKAERKKGRADYNEKNKK